MNNVLSGDHDSLNKFVNSFAEPISNQGASKARSTEELDGFAELLNKTLAGKNLSTASKKSTTINATKTESSEEHGSTKKVQSTAKKAEFNDPNAAFVALGGQVNVTIKNSNSDYKDRIYWSTDNFKTRHYIGIDNQVGNHNIGIFPAGTRIEFGIDNGVGGFYRTGTAAKNSDGIVHALVSKSNGTSVIRFEDMRGGGDHNFSDAIISVQNKPAPPVPKPQSGGDNSNQSRTSDINVGSVGGIINVGNVSNIEPLWPNISPGNTPNSADTILNWLISSVDSDSSTKDNKKCSDLLYYLLSQLANKKQSRTDILSKDDNSKQLSKNDIVSPVDIQWLSALHKS